MWMNKTTSNNAKVKSQRKLLNSLFKGNHLSDLVAMKDAVVAAIEDIKGFDIAVLDVTKLTSMTNYMIVCSANSSRQTKAIADNIYVELKAKGYSPRGMEGEKDGEWVLVDLGEVIWGGESKHMTADKLQSASA
jgi:ribosome silencing factor RsfS/YbeB/iojap